MNTITPSLLLSFSAMIALQLGGVILLPRTEGFTNLGATAALLALFAISYWLLARIVHSGANIGIMIPIMSTIIPLATVAIGVLVYGESASVVRITLLVTACILVGVASRY
jgi:multidrug transporter EmrE-like cation transporter